MKGYLATLAAGAFMTSALVIGAVALSVSSAQAAGCVSGAAVGGVAGHVAGHHGVLGAAAGCAVGHHEAAKTQAQSTSAQPTAPSNQK